MAFMSSRIVNIYHSISDLICSRFDGCRLKSWSSELMLLQVRIPTVDNHVIFPALALEFVQIDFQGSGVGQGEPDPFLASRAAVAA